MKPGLQSEGFGKYRRNNGDIEPTDVEAKWMLFFN